MSLPNIITLGRILLVPVAVWLILVDELGWAFWVCVIAGASDAVDGFIARSFSLRTQLGGYLDPLADKALLVGVFATLGVTGYLPVWLVVMVVFRDLMILSGVLLLHTLKQPIAMQPSPISKVNTACQITLAVAVLALHGVDLSLPRFVDSMILIVAATTVLSGGGYILQGAALLSRLGRSR